MKKLSILLIGLLLITGFAVAQVFDGSVAVTGEASVTFGVDLDTNYTGFFNDADSTITITLVAETDVSATGDDGLYGEIVIDNVKITATPTGLGGSNGTVSAKIVVSPVEILIYAAPGMSWGNAASIEGDGVAIAPALAANNGAGIHGITIVLPVEPAEISVYLVSDGTWVENVNNDYAVGTDVTVTFDPITVDLGGFYGWFTTGATWGGTAALTVSLADVLGGIDVTVGADIVDPGDWEVQFGTAVLLNADETEMAVDVSYSETADLDVELGFTEPQEGGLVDMLDASLTIDLFNLTSALWWGVAVDGGYLTGGLYPYFAFGIDADNVIPITVGVELGADFTGIDNTTVTLEYSTSDINVLVGAITAEVLVEY
jgi:hypothetical protein